MQSIKPKKLKRGDTIGIIASSYPANDILKENWDRGVKALEDMGFKLKFGKYINDIYGHTAGTIADRVEDLMNMFSDWEVSAIMQVWGGYNSHQLLPYLDFEIIKNNPKIFIGYSDTTSLSNAIYAKTGLVNFSGPAFITFTQKELPDYSKKYFEQVLIEGREEIIIEASEKWADDKWWIMNDKRNWKVNPGWKVLKEGVASGVAIGGNIGTLLLLAGTPYWPDMESKILFVEDDDVETSKTLDRFFTQLRHIGVYDKIKGMVIGRFPSEVNFNEKDSLEMIIQEATKGYNFPIISGVDFSHTDPIITIPIGVGCALDTVKPEIKYLEASVIAG